MQSSVTAYAPHSLKAGTPGFHSLSGSDTDVSTSTENLTAEEKSVLQNGVRQEPQGEETVTPGSDIASTGTLVIHGNTLIGEYSSPFYGHIYDKAKSCDVHNYYLIQDLELPDKNENNRQNYVNSESNLMMHNSSSISKGLGMMPPSPKASNRRAIFSGLHKPPIHSSLHQTSANDVSSRDNLSSSNSNMFYSVSSLCSVREHPVQEITDIPKHYLDQSEVLKHLAKEMNHHHSPLDLASVPPPPEYPRWHMPDIANKQSECHIGSSARLDGVGMGTSSFLTRSAESRLSVSRSHPDLTHIGQSCVAEDNCSKLSSLVQRPETRGRAATDTNCELSVCHSSQIVALLSSENASLKSELDLYHKKVSKLQKFELEIQKVHQAHEDLVRSSEKQGKLERAIRLRLEMEIRRLQEDNKQLREQLESMSSHLLKRPSSDVDDTELRKELSKREVLIAQLLTQTKELIAEKERQEIELQAQRATLQEQRNHIDILDNALTNAQTNVVKLEEEVRKKQVYVDRVAQLQKALTNLHVASEKRLQMEKKVRSQLEKELETLRCHKRGETRGVFKTEETESTDSLKKTVLEYEEKVIALEAEVTKWEQRYIEESTMRQIAVDAASVPKDAKIAALEKTSQESEKLIAQARSEKLKHMDELYAATRKCAELEGRIKDFESKLAEKDAMIKVLQQHSKEKDAVLQHAVLGRPPRHTRAASTVGLTTSTCHTATTTGVSSLGRALPSPTNILHRRSESKGELSASSSMLCATSEASDTSLPSPSSSVTESVTANQKSLDEQLKELDSRLSSKDSIISALRAEKERYPNHFWRV